MNGYEIFQWVGTGLLLFIGFCMMQLLGDKRVPFFDWWHERQEERKKKKHEARKID